MQPQRIVITREDIERLIEERNSLAALLDVVRQNLALVTQTLGELRSAKDMLSILKTGNAQDTYAGIGGGVFIKALPVQGEKVLVNVGANYVIEMDVQQAIDYIESRIKEFEDLRSKLDAQLTEIARRISDIDNFLLYISAALRQQRQSQGG
ncbi:MAG: prefoldin subunit alpha [Vulcanisaeta sp.]|jgi:prefoldin alpha subunit|nr:prefoldin subunit alpha [Vulcanisaeta sp.]MCG2869584.1 prefoldin subunit alpha [Vulcanisaeta sp.]MCG2886821.1 prefoldin subunit alpha [Vulcanisaeta sp.]